MMMLVVLITLLCLLPANSDATCNTPNCAVCGADSVCVSCNDGYYFDMGNCTQCFQYCSLCTSAYQCQRCITGRYSLRSWCTGECYIGCHGGDCDDETRHCNECITGKYGSNCLQDCSVCKNEECNLKNCTEGCKDGYIEYDAGSGYSICESCPDNCVTCSNTTYCTQCEQGFYGSYYRDPTYGRGTMWCNQCQTECTQCASIDQCPEWCTIECINKGCATTGSCVAIPSQPPTNATCNTPNCAVCGADSVCVSCNDGYYFDMGNCTQCFQYCSLCTSAYQCQSCIMGRWSLRSRCTGECYIGCHGGDCDDETRHCNKCITGKYGSNCLQDCSVCKNEECNLKNCTEGCKDGYIEYDAGSGYSICESCPDNCVTCSNTTYCTQCEQGFYGSYYQDPTYGRGTMWCHRCQTECTQCASINQCPEWCTIECIRQGCAATGSCVTTPSKQPTICPGECMHDCDASGNCLETTTRYRDSNDSDVLIECNYFEVFGIGLATGIGIIVVMGALVVMGIYLRRRRRHSKSSKDSQVQHTYVNTQIEPTSSGIPVYDAMEANPDIRVTMSEVAVDADRVYTSLGDTQSGPHYIELQAD